MHIVVYLWIWLGYLFIGGVEKWGFWGIFIHFRGYLCIWAEYLFGTDFGLFGIGKNWICKGWQEMAVQVLLPYIKPKFFIARLKSPIFFIVTLYLTTVLY